MFRRIFSAATTLMLVAAFTLASGAPATAATLTISGKVTDAGTNAGIAGVCITVGVPGNFCWTQTNANGDYFVDLGSFGASAGQTWELFFIKGGYTTTSQKKVVNGAETMNQALTANGQPINNTPPPPCVNFQPPGCAINPPPAVQAGPTFTVYLPNITKTLGGANGWHTPFIVQNVGTSSTTVTAAYYSFSTGALIASHGGNVLPGRSFVDSPRDDSDLPGDSQFSVVITSQGAPVVAVVNEHQGPGAGNEALSYSGVSTGASTVYLPLVSNIANGGWLTTMIMQNVGSAPTTVTGTFKSLDGSKTATIQRSVDVGRSAVIDPRVESALSAGVEYSATFSATQPIAVVANNHNDLPGSTAPRGDSYNGVANPTGTAYLPYVPKNTDGASRTARVIVQNAGGAAATPNITLFAFGSGTTTQIPAPAVDAGGTYVFTPPGDGEFSATISGGTFAAVATVNTATTAMYYTSTTQTASKLYVPNITRKLTQNPAVDPGWNTPILIQSAGATGATLSWYRFSDGSLVTSTTVTLTNNVTLRVDPATVGGLSDNSQYAVVIDATGGPLTAIVTELNLVGGDDAMVYKAFLTP